MNTQHHIALCTHIPQLYGNRLLKAQTRATFPGTGWPQHIAKAWRHGDVVTGDVALEKLIGGDWQANQVLIVQSDDSRQGRSLEAKGCKPFLHICWESPLYAFRLYDQVSRGQSAYRFHDMACPGADTIGGEAIIRFACLPGSQNNWGENGETHPNKQSIRPNQVALVAARKPMRSEGLRCLQERQWRSAPFGAVTDLRRLKSKTFWTAWRQETFQDRVLLIKHLLADQLIDVYGKGWDGQPEMKPFRPALKGPCSDKHTTLLNYNFSIALENCHWPGYHTEKLPEAIAAGTIPITRLDPATRSVVPENCYVALETGADANLISSALQNLSPSQRQTMRQAGIDWLQEPTSALYFEANFGQAVARKAEQYLDEKP